MNKSEMIKKMNAEGIEENIIAETVGSNVSYVRAVLRQRKKRVSGSFETRWNDCMAKLNPKSRCAQFMRGELIED